MSHPQRRPLGILAVAILVTAPGLWADQPQSRPRPPGARVQAVTFLDSAAQLWRAVLGYWIPFDRAAEGARHRSGARGSGLIPTCDEGATSDPNGHCVKPSSQGSGLTVACDAGATSDPNGGCVVH